MIDLDQVFELWDKLGDCPINESEELDCDLELNGELFPKGTDIYDIWHWFEETFNISIAIDILNLKHS